MPETLTILIKYEYSLSLFNYSEGLKTHGYVLRTVVSEPQVAAEHILVTDVTLPSTG